MQICLLGSGYADILGRSVVMEIRKEYRKHFVLQKHCPLGSQWPAKERRQRRLETEDFPQEKLSVRCTAEFFEEFHRYWALYYFRRSVGDRRRRSTNVA